MVNTHLSSLRFHRLWGPVLEEPQYFLLVVSSAFFQKTGVLDVEYFAFLVEDHKHGEAEAGGVAEAFHHAGRLLRLDGIIVLARVVVDMDEDEVVGNHLAYQRVAGGEVGKEQAPWAPVAADLADNKLAFGFGLRYSVVNLCVGIDIFVVNLFQGRLCPKAEANEDGGKGK